MWLMTNEAILTKDNLIKRKWKGDLTVTFAHIQKLSHISFSNVLWPKTSGLWWPSVLV
jgi:hypothetical protein